jgi:hypothetical protein
MIHHEQQDELMLLRKASFKTQASPLTLTIAPRERRISINVMSRDAMVIVEERE